jgi:hypothetical protein
VSCASSAAPRKSLFFSLSVAEADTRTVDIFWRVDGSLMHIFCTTNSKPKQSGLSSLFRLAVGRPILTESTAPRQILIQHGKHLRTGITVRNSSTKPRKITFTASYNKAHLRQGAKQTRCWTASAVS